MTAAGRLLSRATPTRAEERLGYYASRFPLVEVDATYYALPSRRTAELWVERTPPDFTFDIKAHALMTGQPTETKRLPEGPPRGAARPSSPRRRACTRRTCRTSSATRSGPGSPTGSSRSRTPASSGSILLQYPRWFFTSSENRDAIEEAIGRLRDGTG